MSISTAKMMVYTLCGGIHPNSMLPIQLDVGTNNDALLNDPMYLGYRKKRLSGKAYESFMDTFVGSLKQHLPHVYLHWEDFGYDHARSNLERYQDQMCAFNDDIQGTGAVALATIMVDRSRDHMKTQPQALVRTAQLPLRVCVEVNYVGHSSVPW